MTTDDELIEAMLVAMYDDGCPGAVDSMRAVLAVVRAHDRDATRCPNCDHLRLQLGELRAELATLRAERDGILAAYKAYMAENRPSRQLYEQHTTELRERAEKAEAERDDALVAVKAMHKLLDRDWAIVDRDITLRCESHDQAWNYLHEMRDLVRAALENVVPYKEPQP